MHEMIWNTSDNFCYFHRKIDTEMMEICRDQCFYSVIEVAFKNESTLVFKVRQSLPLERGTEMVGEFSTIEEAKKFVLSNYFWKD